MAGFVRNVGMCGHHLLRNVATATAPQALSLIPHKMVFIGKILLLMQ